jgi:hypothetical protein
MMEGHNHVRLMLAAAAWVAATSAAVAAENDADIARYTRDAVDRVVESHDHTLLIGGGRLMIKQAAIRSARRLLGEWGREAGLYGEWWDDAPEYRAAKAKLLERADAIIVRRFESGVWLAETWSAYTTREFNGEEADVIATHFRTEGGRKQRMLMDWYLGEMVMFNYTFTDRFDYELKESERELLELQREAQRRIPREDVEFSSRYPEAFYFIACSPEGQYCPGVKYWKMLAIPLMGEIIRHIDGVSREIEDEMRARRPEIQPYIEAFKANRR